MNKYILSIQSLQRNRTIYKNPCQFVVPVYEHNKNNTFKDPVSLYAPLQSWTNQFFIHSYFKKHVPDHQLSVNLIINDKQMTIETLKRPNTLIVHFLSKESIDYVIQEPNYFKNKSIAIYTKNNPNSTYDLILNTSIQTSQYLQFIEQKQIASVTYNVYSIMFTIKDDIPESVITSLNSSQIDSTLFAYFYYDTNVSNGIFYVPGHNLFHEQTFILMNETKHQSVICQFSKETNLFYCKDMQYLKNLSHPWSNDDYYSISKQTQATFSFSILGLYPQHIVYDGSHKMVRLTHDFIQCFNIAIPYHSFRYRIETNKTNSNLFQVNDVITIKEYKVQLRLVRIDITTLLWEITSDVSNIDIPLQTLNYQFNTTSGTITLQKLLIYVKKQDIFDRIQNNHQKGLSMFHHVSITHDNSYVMSPKPFIHSKSYLSHIKLVSLALPNLLLQSNQYLTDAYQSISIALYNVHQPSKSSVYVNNGLQHKKILFVIPLHEIKIYENFIHVHPSNIEIVTQLNPNQDIYFKILDIHGNVIQYNMNDTVSPYYPKNELQVCAQFNVVLLE